MTTSSDPETDRSSGELVWFCSECGHRPHPPAGEEPGRSAAADDITELFDRH